MKVIRKVIAKSEDYWTTEYICQNSVRSSFEEVTLNRAISFYVLTSKDIR